MIQISLTTALALYSTALGVVVLAIWTYTEVTVRRAHLVLAKQFLWRCVFCGYMYLDEEAGHVSQCPQCESYNSTDDKHARFVKARAATYPFEEESTPPPSEPPRRNPSHRKSPNKRRRGPRRH